MPYRPLAGAFEKVRRANECIKTLDDEIGGLEKGDKPYGFDANQDMQCIEGVEMTWAEAQQVGAFLRDYPSAKADHVFVPLITAELMGIYLVVKRPLPLLKWGSLIGDAVNNLRSALDQLTWELSIHHQRSLSVPKHPLPKSDTLPRGSFWSKIQFPVTETSSRWSGNVSSVLGAIDQNLVSKFDDEQPYKRGKFYQRHWLWLLNELWNRDKHRSVAITAMYGATSEVVLCPAEGETITLEEFRAEFDVRQQWVQSAGRFKNGMKLAQLLIARKAPRYPQPHVNLDVYTTLRMGIQFKKAAPTYGAGVLDTLERLSGEVERVLNGFVADFK